MLQLGMIGLAFAAAFGLILPILVLGSAGITVARLAPNTIFLIVLGAALWMLRRGHFDLSLGIVIAALLVATSYSVLTVNLLQTQLPLLVFMLPIIMAGMMVNRRTLLVVTAISIAVVGVSLGQRADTLPPTQANIPWSLWAAFSVVLGLFAFMLGLFGRTLRAAVSISSALATANRQLYEDAREQQQQLEVTLSSIGDAVIATDARGRITFINPVASSLMGWSAEAAMNQALPDVFRIINEHTRASVENPAEKVIREGIVVGLANHTLLVTRDGDEIPIDDSGAPIRDAAGAISGVVLVFRDVSERKRADERAQALQDLTAALSEALTREQVADVIMEKGLAAFGGHLGTVCLLTEDGENLVIFNRVGLPDASYQPNIVTPLSHSAPLTDAIRRKELIWTPDRETYIARYPDYADAVIRNGTHASANVPLLYRNQPIGGINISFPEPRPATAEDRAFLLSLAGYCAQALDRASLYETEAKARREAEEANEIKLKFLAMISHELRTPLTSIKGFASSLLAEDVKFAPNDQQHFIHIIDEEADRLTDLVDQLLDVSQLQAGTLRLKPARTTFAHILELAEPRLKTVSEGYQLVLAIDPVPDLTVDAERIAQMLVNLIANAAKYSPPATRITLSVQAIPGAVQVNVSDEGQGIDPEDREKVFESFWQIERDGKRQRGAGLGLAIARGIAEAHGGRIWIADRPEPGTTVSFTLPVRSDDN